MANEHIHDQCFYVFRLMKEARQAQASALHGNLCLSGSPGTSAAKQKASEVGDQNEIACVARK